MLTSPSTCAVVPAFDCESSVGAVVTGIQQQGIEVAVVDDGSTDGTAAAARAAGAHLLSHPHNRGKGHALITGFRWALTRGFDAVLTLDADGQHDPADIPGLLHQAAGVDLLIGRRQVGFSVMPLASFIGNCTGIFWISLFCGRFFPDTQSGFRLYSRRLLETIPLAGGRFETETEILIRASRLGWTIRHVPITTIYEPRDTPHRTNFRNRDDSLRVIAVVLRSLAFPRRAR